MRSILSMLLAMLIIGGCVSSRTALQKGEHIVFFGDSITQAGIQPGGYITQVRDSLTAAHPDLGITVTGAGISGNKIDDLLARVDRDVLAKKPTTVVVYIGINDVWHWSMPNHNGTTPEGFESGMGTLVDKLKAADARVILCTPSVIGEQSMGTNKQDAELDRYSDITRKVARSRNVQVCDLRQAFGDHLRSRNTQNAAKGILTSDGVHLNPAGNTFVARQMLAALRRK